MGTGGRPQRGNRPLHPVPEQEHLGRVPRWRGWSTRSRRRRPAVEV